MTPNFEKILKRKEWFLSKDHEYMQSENQHFYPFYVFDNFEVKTDEPVYCDYCGELLEGNGLYDCAYFVFESDNDIRVCCNIHKCHPGKVWDFHCQKHGQPEPLRLPEQSTVQQRMVFNYFFSGKSCRYEEIELNEKLLIRLGFTKNGVLYENGKFAIKEWEVGHQQQWQVFWGDSHLGQYNDMKLHELQNLFFALNKTELHLKPECSTCG